MSRIDQERSTNIAEVSGKTADQISSTLNHLNNEAAVLPAMLNTSSVDSFEGCGTAVSSPSSGAAALSAFLRISRYGSAQLQRRQPAAAL
jgi:hypothetical protein